MGRNAGGGGRPDSWIEDTGPFTWKLAFGGSRTTGRERGPRLGEAEGGRFVPNWYVEIIFGAAGEPLSTLLATRLGEEVVEFAGLLSSLVDGTGESDAVE